MHEVHGQVQGDGLEVRLREDRGHVKVDIEELGQPSRQARGLLGLFHLELREHLQEPLEGPLLAVDPDEVDLFQFEAPVDLEAVRPSVVAVRADALGLPIPGKPSIKRTL